MRGIEELFIVVWMLFGILLTPLFFIAFDYWAGIRKAHQRGEPIRSDKMKRTVDKIARYYNALLALVVLDAMQMVGIWYLDNYCNCGIPIFPLITLVGAFGVGLIEIKSINEPANEKERREYKEVAAFAVELAKHRTDPAEIAKAVMEYMNKGVIKDDDNK